MCVCVRVCVCACVCVYVWGGGGNDLSRAKQPNLHPCSAYGAARQAAIAVAEASNAMCSDPSNAGRATCTVGVGVAT